MKKTINPRLANKLALALQRNQLYDHMRQTPSYLAGAEAARDDFDKLLAEKFPEVANREASYFDKNAEDGKQT